MVGVSYESVSRNVKDWDDAQARQPSPACRAESSRFEGSDASAKAGDPKFRELEPDSRMEGPKPASRRGVSAFSLLRVELAACLTRWNKPRSASARAGAFDTALEWLDV
jgi:hypothetical protein